MNPILPPLQGNHQLDALQRVILRFLAEHQQVLDARVNSIEWPAGLRPENATRVVTMRELVDAGSPVGWI